MQRRLVVPLTAVLMITGACSSSDGSASTPSPSVSTRTTGPATTSPTSPTASPTSSGPVTGGPGPSTTTSTPDVTATTRARQVYEAMTEAERVGQLLMVDCPSTGLAAATEQAIRTYHVGAVILDGNNTSGRASIASLTARLQRLSPASAKLLIATDQEGGLVQRLTGPGFSRIPSAVVQGEHSSATLRKDARAWGRQLKLAGVNVDLAPVLDTVPADFGSNPPIGDLDREYGTTPAAVSAHGVAVAHGLTDSGVIATVKHFPGLGRVRGNTDTTSGVTDSVTTRHDAYLAPFATAVRTGVPFVMVSSAEYSRIAPGVPAMFSRTIVTGMLRDDLHFTGVVITDDVGGARQVASYPVGQRAVRFVQAGGDIILTVVASQAATMTKALLAKAKASPAFKKLVDAAALRVLTAKDRFGLLR